MSVARPRAKDPEYQGELLYAWQRGRARGIREALLTGFLAGATAGIIVAIVLMTVLS